MKGKEQLSFEIEEEKSKSDNKEEKCWKLEFYEEKNFKDTEIGPIPEDWEVVRLGEAASFESGKRMKGGSLKVGEVLSLGGEHIDDFGNVDISEPKFITKEFYNQMKKGKLYEGDIVLCKDGAKTGKLAYIKKLPFKYVSVNEHIFIIRSISSCLYNHYLFYTLFSEIGQNQIKQVYHGLIGGITNENIKNLLAPLPPLAEQKAIAEVLSTIQSAREKTEEVIKATKELKKSIMKHLFTYGPVPIDQIDKIKLKETEIGPIPEHWEVVRLGEVFLLINKKEREIRIIDDEVYRLLSVRLYAKGITLRTVQLGARIGTKVLYRTEEDDFVFSKIDARNGAWGFVDKDLAGGLVSGDFPILRLYPVKADKIFIYYLLSRAEIWEPLGNWVIGTTNRKRLQVDQFLSIKIPLPPLAEQQKISEILQSIDEKIQKEEEKKKALDNLFKAMLSNLMSGKIRVKILEGN